MPKPKKQSTTAATFTGTATATPSTVNRGDTCVITGTGASPKAFVAYTVDIGDFAQTGDRWAGSVQADDQGAWVLNFPTSRVGTHTATFGPQIAQCTFEVV